MFTTLAVLPYTRGQRPEQVLLARLGRRELLVTVSQMQARLVVGVRTGTRQLLCDAL